MLLSDLGRSSGNTNMLREAEPLKREALAGCREVLGNRHPHTLASISNLADMLMQLGHLDPRAFEEAEPLCREARDTSKTPPRHLPDTSLTPPGHLPDTSRTPP